MRKTGSLWRSDFPFVWYKTWMPQSGLPTRPPFGLLLEPPSGPPIFFHPENMDSLFK